MLQRLHTNSLENNPRSQNNQHHSLDLEYLSIHEEILSSDFMKELATKHVKIRIQAWLDKLSHITSNTLWKRNRNSYAKLINLVCQCEVVVDPFLSLPPEGGLAKLSKHRINSIIDAVERQVKYTSRQSRQSYRGCKGDDVSQQSLGSANQEYQKENYYNLRENEKKNFVKERFARTEQVNNKSISFDVENGVYFSTAESVKSFKASKNGSFSQNKNKQAIDTPNESFYGNSYKFSKFPPKRVTVKINTPINQVELPRTFARSQSNQEYTQNGSIDTSNCMKGIDEQSLDLSHNRAQDNTLNTELFDQDFPSQDHNLDEDCDFSGQISERCREKDQILRQTYFSWKKQQPSSIFSKQGLKFSTWIPSKPLHFDPSPLINASFQSIDHNTEEKEQVECSFEEIKTVDGILLKDVTSSIHNLVD